MNSSSMNGMFLGVLHAKIIFGSIVLSSSYYRLSSEAFVSIPFGPRLSAFKR